MQWNLKDRFERQHNISSGQPEQREHFEKDRDRVLYCSAYRRLGGVAQIVSADHNVPFHNRLTHSQKVAQLGERLAQDRLRKQPKLCAELGVHSEVVEAACLAHDLGHPPFGHPVERELDALIRKDGVDEGFEGNAQSFRIVTKLALRTPFRPGLDLTRATLSAMLKYPWKYDGSDEIKGEKWGYYASEEGEFQLARSWLPAELKATKTAEAELMDWADDITYSVHDLEDFHRAGAIPWHLYEFRLFPIDNPYRRRLVENALRSWKKPPADGEGRLEAAINRLKNLFGQDHYRSVFTEPYEGTRLQRSALRQLTSVLIGKFVHAIELKEPDPADNYRCIQIDAQTSDEIRILKQITRQFIHEDPALGAQQRGHLEIVRSLYSDFKEDISSFLDSSGRKPLRFVPKKFHYFVEDALDAKMSVPVPRLVGDCLASLSEAEAFGLFMRLRGLHGGSVRDPIVR